MKKIPDNFLYRIGSEKEVLRPGDPSLEGLTSVEDMNAEERRFYEEILRLDHYPPAAEICQNLENMFMHQIVLRRLMNTGKYSKVEIVQELDPYTGDEIGPRFKVFLATMADE